MPQSFKSFWVNEVIKLSNPSSIPGIQEEFHPQEVTIIWRMRHKFVSKEPDYQGMQMTCHMVNMDLPLAAYPGKEALGSICRRVGFSNAKYASCNHRILLWSLVENTSGSDCNECSLQVNWYWNGTALCLSFDSSECYRTPKCGSLRGLCPMKFWDCIPGLLPFLATFIWRDLAPCTHLKYRMLFHIMTALKVNQWQAACTCGVKNQWPSKQHHCSCGLLRLGDNTDEHFAITWTQS